MPRTTPADRACKVIEVAATVFVDLGYRRAQMDDVADRLGVSKGTLYRSVPSKEGLLAAVLTHGDRPADLAPGGVIDVAPLSEVGERLPRRLAALVATLELARVAAGTATAARSDDDMPEQVERMARELYETMAHHRVTIMVLDRCAAEVPELAGWFGAGRYAVVDLWESYLDRVGDRLDAGIDRSVLARTIVELITLWAVKMPWDPSPRPYPGELGATCGRLVARLVTGART